MQELRERPGKTESFEGASIVGRVPAAEGRAEAPRRKAPGTAAQNPTTTIPSSPRPPVTRRASVSLIPAVLYPLPHVPRQIV